MSFYGAPKKHMSFRELLRESRKEYSASVFENEVWSDVEIPTKLMSAEMNSIWTWWPKSNNSRGLHRKSSMNWHS